MAVNVKILFEPRTSRCVWVLKVKQMFKFILKQSHSCFWARLQNWEKPLLVTSCLSVRLSFCPSLSPHATTQLPLVGLPENFVLSIC